MEKTTRARQAWRLMVALSCAMVMLGIFFGCHDDDDASIPPRQPLALKIIGADSDGQAKAVSVTITAVGLGKNDEEIGQTFGPMQIASPSYPLSVPLTLRIPPCRYRLTVETTRLRDEMTVESTVVNICETTTVTVGTRTFEPMETQVGPITLPSMALAGSTIAVSCSLRDVDAPDRDRFPVTATLREANSNVVVTGALPGQEVITGEFPDPHPLENTSAERVFTCTFSDGRSPEQTFTASVPRVLPTPTPTPEPTATVTSVPTAAPTATVTSVPTAAPTPKPTATPTPFTCVVTTNANSGAGSLREKINKRCSLITFNPSVTTITLAAQLEIPSGLTTTIDGGSGVTVSGNNAVRVFYVNSGANVTFNGLTITQGDITGGSYCFNGINSNCGGGIYNDGGTINVNSAMISNYASDGGGIYNNNGNVSINAEIKNCWAFSLGGGIYNNGGNVTINSGGSVNNSSSGGHGAGIYNNGGTVTVDGSVSNNQATDGAGIYNTNSGNVTIASGGVVNGNDGSDGSGIYNDGGTVTVDATSATIRRRMARGFTITAERSRSTGRSAAIPRPMTAAGFITMEQSQLPAAARSMATIRRRMARGFTITVAPSLLMAASAAILRRAKAAGLLIILAQRSRSMALFRTIQHGGEAAFPILVTCWFRIPPSSAAMMCLSAPRLAAELPLIMERPPLAAQSLGIMSADGAAESASITERSRLTASSRQTVHRAAAAFLSRAERLT